ncbi:hypothetical protein NVP1231O_23 [Vibrio phage 1.231.O._10N.261.49.F8]|nr:hypothetical protein NVP1231O_23 [Vibrio phage 1.231.O._10N.261.49.F8]
MTEKFGTNVYAPVVAGNDTDDDMAVAYAGELQGAVQPFENIAARDAWATKFKSRLYKTVAFIITDDDHYKWDGVQEDGSDGKWVKVDKYTGLTLTDKENTEWSPVNNILFPQAEFNQVGQKTQITFPLGDGSDFMLSVKDAAGTDNIGLDTLTFKSSLVEVDALDKKEVTINPFVEFISETVGSEEPNVNSVTANSLKVIHPLEVFSDPDAELAAELSIAHGSLEMGHAPAHLAYANSEIAIVGKEGLSGHHDGAVWFTDMVYPSNAFMSVDEAAKTISIQEADTLDPNVTGGTDYLVAYRIHMQGNAPDDGKVRIYLWDTVKKAYLKDVNGEPMGSQRLYKQGEELGYISVIGVVNAKGTTTFTTHVMDDFVDDELIISSRTEGASGILVQALTSEEKTSPALLQFEQDTNQQIDFGAKYFGPNLITLNWMLQEDSPEFTAPAGSIKGLNDGSLVYAIGQTKMSIADKTLSLLSADFNLGKFVNPDDTHMLKGKTIKAYTTLANPDGDLVMAMFKWTGKPGEATTKIYGARNQGGGIVPVAGWEQVEEDVIVANALGDFKEYSHNFTVPDDAVEIAIILYPSLGLTTDSIHIKGFNADVVNPFMGYIVKAPELYTEQHLKSDPQYAKLVQDRQGYASLRYTLNNVPTTGVPMPVGMVKAGKANITIDDSVNIVVGSAARGGEGAIKFGEEGRIVVKSDLYIYPGESLPKGNKATARFWYALVSDDGQTFTKIDDSETSFLVTGGDLPSKCKMNTFGMDVNTGDRIALFSLTDATDDAYIISDYTGTMLTTEIDFEEIIAQGYDDTDLISAPIPKASVFDRRVHLFTGNSQQNVVIDLDIPADVELAEIEAVKHSGSITTSIKDCEYSYDSSTKKLTVHVGNGVADGKIYLTFWSGVA